MEKNKTETRKNGYTLMKAKQEQEKRELTLRVEGLKIKKEPRVYKGFTILVGKDKNGGMFEYFKGNKKEARRLGMKMKTEYRKMLFKRQKQEPLYLTLTPTKLKKCDLKYCNRWCEAEEQFCLRCEDLMFEAQVDRAEQLKEERELLN